MQTKKETPLNGDDDSEIQTPISYMRSVEIYRLSVIVFELLMRI